MREVSAKSVVKFGLEAVPNFRLGVSSKMPLLTLKIGRVAAHERFVWEQNWVHIWIQHYNFNQRYKFCDIFLKIDFSQFSGWTNGWVSQTAVTSTKKSLLTNGFDILTAKGFGYNKRKDKLAGMLQLFFYTFLTWREGFCAHIVENHARFSSAFFHGDENYNAW